MTQEKRFGLSSTTLRFIAMAFMLLDHMWATLVPGNNWMTYMGRMAMPIFAFLIAEGYAHTRSVKNYKKRLFIFGLIIVSIAIDTINQILQIHINSLLFLFL